MRKTKFNIDNNENIYEGYTYGDTWNGWACPYFTKEVADQMTKDYEEAMYYEERLDAYIVVDSNHDNLIDSGAKDLIDRILEYAKPNKERDYEIKNIESILIGLDFEVFRGEDVVVNGETLHLYDIGNSYWIWDEYECEDMAECKWCGEVYEESELKSTDCGKLCDRCIAAIRSRGESITIKYGEE